MAYKPLSQTVTDGQKNPISSDAVHDAIDAIPASASLTLDNLTAPTAVNQNLNFQNDKVAVFNSATVPAFTNNAANKSDIFLTGGFIGSSPTGSAFAETGQGTIVFGANMYQDGNTSRFLRGNGTNSGGGAARFDLLSGSGSVFGNECGFLVRVASTAIAGNPITWTTLMRAFRNQNQNGLTGLDNIGGLTSITTGTETIASSRLGNEGANRFAHAHFAANVSIATSAQHAAGNFCNTIKPRFNFASGFLASPFPNNSTTVYIQNGAETHRFKIGDYIQIGDLPAIGKILSISGNAYTVDVPMGNGASGTLFTYKPAVLIKKSDNITCFEIDYKGDTFIDAAVVINDSGADNDTRIEGDTDANLVFVDASTDRVGIGTATPAEKLEVNGNIKATSGDVSIATAGKGLKVAEGSNAKMGTATLSAGTFTVATTAVTNNSRIFLTVQSLGTVSDPKAIAVTGRTDGQDFTITSADNTDTSVVAWMIVEPA